jgi:hypothetical protein
MDQPWQGVDRLLKSVLAYKGNRKIKFNMVGNVPEEYLNFVKINGLSDKIKFWGPLSQNEANKIIKKCHVAMSGLAIFRKGNKEACSLKIREYCSRGIPFILSLPDPDFADSLDFVRYIPNDNSLINFNVIFDLADSFKKDSNMSDRIIAYSKSKLHSS